MHPQVVATAIAVALVLVPQLWRYSRHLVTLVHEAGHAVVAVLTGRRLSGIRLHRDTSGITESIGRPTGPGMVLTALAGYPAPPAAGVGLLVLVAQGREAAAWWAVFGGLVAMVVFIRNWFGLLVVAVCGVGVWILQDRGSDALRETLGAGLAWVLLVGGLRATIDLWGHRRRSRSATSDADVLARLTRLPAALWNIVFISAAIGCGWLAWRVVG